MIKGNRILRLIHKMELKLQGYDNEVLEMVREQVRLTTDDMYYFNGLLMKKKGLMITEEEASTMLDIIRKGKEASTAEMMVVFKVPEIAGGSMLSR